MRRCDRIILCEEFVNLGHRALLGSLRERRLAECRMCEPRRLLLLSELVMLFSPHLGSLLSAEEALAPSWKILETLSPSAGRVSLVFGSQLGREESGVDLVCIHPLLVVCGVHMQHLMDCESLREGVSVSC